MVTVLIVTQEGCTPCKRIRRIIDESKRENLALQVQEVKFSSPEGVKLAIEYQILYPPAVFIDGHFFGKGKIREDELKTALQMAAITNGNTMTG